MKVMIHILKNIIKGTALLAFCLSAFPGYGQISTPLTQYARLPYLSNPAATGMERGVTDIKVGTRYQWVSSDDSPKSYFLGANHAFGDDAIRVGLGGLVVQESTDVYKDLQAGITAAVHVPVSQKMHLALGFKVDYSRFSVNMEHVRVRDEHDQFYRDLMASDGAVAYLNISPGVMLHSDNFYIGYSALRLVQARLDHERDSKEEPALQHTAMLGYIHALTPDWELLPSVLVQLEDQYDPLYHIMGKVRYRAKFWAGVGFSPNNAISGLVGLSPTSSFNVSYCYGHSIGDAAGFNRGSSHELIVGFPLGSSAPRFFW